MSDTLKFRWGGTIYAGRIIGEGTEGRTRIEALEHGPRFAVGTHLDVEASDIVMPFDTGAPPVRADDPDALQQAMNEERKLVPSVAEVIADPNPTPPLSASASSPAAAPTAKDEPMSDRLSEKLAQVAFGAAEVSAAIEQRADSFLARKAALMERQDRVFSMHERVLSASEAGLDSVENALRQFSNSLPGGAG